MEILEPNDTVAPLTRYDDIEGRVERLVLHHCYNDRLSIERDYWHIDVSATRVASTEPSGLLIGSWEVEANLTFARVSPPETRMIIYANNDRLFGIQLGLCYKAQLLTATQRVM